MARAGYDPHEAVQFWQRMEQASNGRASPEFLSTHPSHGHRIDEVQNWLPEAMKAYESSSYRR